MRTHFEFGLRDAAFTSASFGILGCMVGYYLAPSLTNNKNEQELQRHRRLACSIFGIVGLLGGAIAGLYIGSGLKMFVIPEKYTESHPRAQGRNYGW